MREILPWAVLGPVAIVAAGWLGCVGNPMSGLSFACDPDGPSTCSSGYVCVRNNEGSDPPGVCTPIGSLDAGTDPGSLDEGPVDSGIHDQGHLEDVTIDAGPQDAEPVDGGDIPDECPESTPCDDGDPCTFDDRCEDDGCVGTRYDCFGHGTCDGSGSCVCDTGFDGNRCARCAAEYRDYPTCVSEVRSVVTGTGHSCALHANGKVTCWGYGGSGQLGGGSRLFHPTPVDVDGLDEAVRQVASGLYHTCAILESGGLKCWGRNESGQLGDGSTSSSRVPVDVAGLPGFAQDVSLGYHHSCAVLTTGAALCWGGNENGELGDGTVDSSTAPVPVSGLSAATAVAVGWYHTCALLTDGSVRCWGDNGTGQLGSGTTADSLAPVETAPLAGKATALAAGPYHSCALLADGAVQCWGKNSSGQVGDGTTTSRASPTSVVGLSGPVVGISVGPGHSCGVLEAGGVECWGYNATGALGDGGDENRLDATPVAGLPAAATSVAAGGGGGQNHSCAVLVDGRVACWGSNGYGQLGDGTAATRGTPGKVFGLASQVAVVAGRVDHTCAIDAEGVPSCWGANNVCQVDGSQRHRSYPSQVVGTPSVVVSLALGGYHTLALLPDHSLLGWGYNQNGELGMGSTAVEYERTPVVAGGGQSFGSIAGGQYHSCALSDTGGVFCWGYNNKGQLGDGSKISRNLPVPVQGLVSGCTSIVAGYSHSCALLETGGVKCWGSANRGQLGNELVDDEPHSSPSNVSDLSSGAQAITAGSYHSCALLPPDRVRCWGRNDHGQLGDGSTTDRASPVDVQGLAGTVLALGGGALHTCALMEGGDIYCWGRNDSGQLGTGTWIDSALPVRVAGLPGPASRLTTGAYHNCVLMGDGTPYCWGLNEVGQLGDGMAWKTLPVEVAWSRDGLGE